MSIAENFEQILNKISKAAAKRNRAAEQVHVVAVTKYTTIERAEAALEAGVRHLGESRDVEFLNKHQAIGSRAEWHFIGTLQSKKVKNILPYVSYIHSLDRLSLAKEINKRAESIVNCFVQVNASGEKSKHGVAPDDTFDFVSALADYPHIRVIGLMTMAPLTEDTDKIRQCFKTVKLLQQEIAALKLDYAPCTELSMGMSNDFEIAVEEGATFVRIGSALIGS